MTKKHALYLSLPLATLLAAPLFAQEATKPAEGTEMKPATTEAQPAKPAKKHMKHAKKAAKAEEKKAEEKKAEETKTMAAPEAAPATK